MTVRPSSVRTGSHDIRYLEHSAWMCSYARQSHPSLAVMSSRLPGSGSVPTSSMPTRSAPTASPMAAASRPCPTSVTGVPPGTWPVSSRTDEHHGDEVRQDGGHPWVVVEGYGDGGPAEPRQPGRDGGLVGRPVRTRGDAGPAATRWKRRYPGRSVCGPVVDAGLVRQKHLGEPVAQSRRERQSRGVGDGHVAHAERERRYPGRPGHVVDVEPLAADPDIDRYRSPGSSSATCSQSIGVNGR